ncbi:hypothetical protein ACHAWF_007292 [Thalassiosira exigua]
MSDEDDAYSSYVPAATARDFAVPTACVVGAAAAAVVPLARLVRRRRRRRRAAAAARGLADGGGEDARGSRARGDEGRDGGGDGADRGLDTVEVYRALIESAGARLDFDDDDDDALAVPVPWWDEAEAEGEDDGKGESDGEDDGKDNEEDGAEAASEDVLVVPRPQWYARLLPWSWRLADQRRRILEEQSATLSNVLWAAPPPDVGGGAAEDGVAIADAAELAYFLDEPASASSAATKEDDPPSPTAAAEAAAAVPERPRCLAKSRRTARILLAWDAEASRIVRIALPATIASAGSAFCDAATSALVSRHWGTDAYVAYGMACVLGTLVGALVGGVTDASGVLVAQAAGSGRGYLAGQYEQAALMLKYAVATPLYGLGYYYFVELVSWMGLEEDIGELGLDYLPWLLLSYPVSDCAAAVSELMWAEERGGTMTIIDNVYYVMYVALLLGLVYGVDAGERPTLLQLGMLDLGASVLYLAMIVVVVERRGWLEPYKKGLYRSLSVRNFKLVRSILAMALPLTIGGIVSTCEWEILTVFAAHMGELEVAAWYILGSVWGVFEYLPQGFTTAAEIRVSRHLADGQPAAAKVAAYKSLLYSLVVTSATTALFCHYRGAVVAMYTDVQVIADMLADLIFLVGIANVVMVVGVVAYTIICAQNRANLATGTYASLSFAVTLPLSAYFVFVKGYDLQSTVFSLIAGYSLSSMVLVVILLTTNWTKCSEAVVRKADMVQKEQERLSRLRAERKLPKQDPNEVADAEEMLQYHQMDSVEMTKIVDKSDGSSGGKPAVLQATQTALTTPKKKKKRGWREYADPASGKKYYSNGTTTTWDKPTDFGACDPSAPDKKGAGDEAETLPMSASQTVFSLLPSPPDSACN